MKLRSETADEILGRISLIKNRRLQVEHGESYVASGLRNQEKSLQVTGENKRLEPNVKKMYSCFVFCV